MRDRLLLLFPYLLAALVVAVLVWGGPDSDVTAVQSTGEFEICPDCGNEVDTSTAVQRTMDGFLFYFCCEGCAGRFESAMEGAAPSEGGVHLDPVCYMEVGDGIDSLYKGQAYHFCTEICRERFNEDPERYLAEVCMVCRSLDDYTPLDPDSPYEVTWQGETYHLCSEEHRKAFRDDPGGYFMHTMWGIPNALYYASIALVLLVSFVIIESRAGKDRKRPRIDLFRFSWIRGLLTSPITRFTCQAVAVFLFLLIIAAGLFGNQMPSKNIAPILTWTIWWGGLIWLVAYAGKAWCYVCPWDALSDWAESLRFFGKKKRSLTLGLKWPRFMRNIWPATILFIALTWVELGFGVTMVPRATAWLGLAMLGLTFVSVFVFDRKSFCRYGCLVGRISGLYALFAPVEVRASEAEECKTCRTQSCFKGNDQGEPCPTFEHLRTMRLNTYCIACMECAKSCEKENVSLNLRPWGEDLSVHQRPRSDEAYLALLMLSLTGFHGLTMTPVWRQVVGWIETNFHLGETVAFSLGMIGVMVAPVLLYAILVSLSRALSGEATVSFRDYFIRYAYALLPIALFYHLAHNSEHLLMEGQKVVALLSDPFGYEWDLLGTTNWTIEPLIDLQTLWILQILFVMIGHVYSLWTARCTAGLLFGDSKAALRSQVPMLAAMILFSVMSLWLLKQPMEMRTSAM